MPDYSFKEESKKMLCLLKYTRQWKKNVGVTIFFYVLSCLRCFYAFSSISPSKTVVVGPVMKTWFDFSSHS